MTATRFLLSLSLSALIILSNSTIFDKRLEAGSRGGSHSSGGYSKSSSWSSNTQGTWNRNGGGFFGSDQKSSSGYSKPSLDKTSPSSGFSKPQFKEQPSSGYSKPSTETKPTSSGYTKPSLDTKSTLKDTSQTPSKTSGGYSKPTASSSAKEMFDGGSKFDKGAILQERKLKAQQSLEKYKSENSKFKNPEYKVEGAESSPLNGKAKVYSGFDYGTHYDRRDNYYRAQGYQPPQNAFNSSPSFGLFNSIFLFWMLDHMSNKNVAATAYHHENDPGFQKWRQDVESQAKDNVELKAKLAEMDKQIKGMEGTPKNPGYLPPGVPPEAALATEIFASKKPEKPLLRVAAGQVGGLYDKFAHMFEKVASGMSVKIITTSGSLENLRLLSAGQADLALIQSDLLAMREKKLPGKELVTEQATLYIEYVQLIANRRGGIKSVKDIDPSKNVIFIGPKGSGTAMTWEALCEQDERYRKIPIKYEDYSTSLDQVQNNPNALMLFVGGLNSDFLKKAEERAKKSGNLRLVAVDDRKLVDKLDGQGNAIYRFVQIPSNVYPHLQKGWIFKTDVETLAVEAVVVLRNEWAANHGTESMDALSLAVMETKPEIQRFVNGIN